MWISPDLRMRRACIDIGSNTTRLLVAECDGKTLLEVHQERAFTRIGRGLLPDGSIEAAKIREVVDAVEALVQLARELQADDLHAVATAAIRRAANGTALVAAITEACGVGVRILSGEEEARLAFVGATRTLDHAPADPLGVVDVGGGSSELVVGSAPDRVTWWRSFEFGSSDLAREFLDSDPPTPAEFDAARARISGVLGRIDVPRPAEAFAVGGSATSLRRLAGPVLDGETFERCLAMLSSETTCTISQRYALDHERVRLLPAGLLVLEAMSKLFGVPLQIARGGVREGVLLEASG